MKDLHQSLQSVRWWLDRLEYHAKNGDLDMAEEAQREAGTWLDFVSDDLDDLGEVE